MTKIQRYIPTSSHGGMIPVESTSDSTYIAYPDHAAEIARLRAEADALRVDAERYRFIRSGGCGATLRFHNSSPANRDEVIDEAMGADA